MPPNILWIVTTQWRGQALGLEGDPNASTPFLDALARSGTLCRQAVTPHPFGPFARAAMLTGISSPENGVRDYFDPMPAGARTLAHKLGAMSYDTAFFGKWHLSRRDPRARLVGDEHARTIVPEEHRGGFRFWEGFESGFQINDPWLHGTRLPEPVRFAGYQSDVLCRRALETLGSLRAPWFAVVSLESPHPPYDAPCPGSTPRSPGDIVLRANVPAIPSVEGRARGELAGYYAHIEATDRSIGFLLGGLSADTRIVATSVHGDMHGSHGLFRKGWPHEESVRVPLVIRGPVSEGCASGPVSLVDLPGLALSWAQGSDGWGPQGRFARISMPSVVALGDQCDRAWRGVRSPSRKFVAEASGKPWLLYDLENDPLETRNLVSEPGRKGEVDELGRLLTP